MPAWVRVHLPGVGEWSQRDDVAVPDDATVLDGVDGLGPDGRPLPDIPEAPTPSAEPAPEAAPAGKTATKPGDTKAAGTTAGTTTKEQ